MRRLLTLLSVWLAGATVARADSKNPTYVDDVLPVLKQHCINCHSDDKQRGGLNLANFDVTMQGGASGAVVTAGDPDKSRLYTLSAHKEEPVMPPSKQKIPEAQLEVLRLWIEQGARETSSSKVSVAAKPKMDLSLKTVSRGKPEGAPPMPAAGKLRLDPVVITKRAGAILSLSSSPWAPLIAVGGQKQILLYHAEHGDLLGVLPFEAGQIHSLKFSRNGKMLLAAGGRGGASGKAVLYNIETGEKVTEVGSAETDVILSADLSPDQSAIAVGTPTRMVRIYSTTDGSVIHAIKKHTDWVTSVEYSPDGVLVASADRNGGLFVWEAGTAREFHTLRGHTQMITEVSWRADSNLLVSGSLDGTIRLWEMENGRQVKQWAGHGGGVEGVRFGMDGRLTSTGRDRVTKLWDGNGGLQKQFEALPDVGLQATLTHDSSRVVAGDNSGSLRWYSAQQGTALISSQANPPSRADQLKALEAEAAAAQQAEAAATSQLQATQDAAQKKEAELAAAQAMVKAKEAEFAAAMQKRTTWAAQLAEAQAKLAKAKTDLEPLSAQLAAATMTWDAVQVSHPLVVERAKKLQEAASKAPQNSLLQTKAKAAQEELKASEAEYKQAEESLKQKQLAQKQASELVANLTAAVTKITAELAALDPMLPGLKAQAEAAQKQTAELAKQLEAARQDLAQHKAKQEQAAAQRQTIQDRLKRMKP